MSAQPILFPAPGVPANLSAQIAGRLRVIEASTREIVTQLRRLQDEAARLRLAQQMLGVETEDV